MSHVKTTSSKNPVAICLIIAMLGGAYFCLNSSSVAQEEEKEKQEKKLDEIEKKIREIAAAMRKARQQGRRDEVAELEEVAEKLLGELEEEDLKKLEGLFEELERFEQEEEEEFSDEEAHELEIENLRVNLEARVLDLKTQRLELAVRTAEVSEQYETSAAYAITQALSHMEGEDAVKFLKKMLKSVKSPAIRRVILHNLAEIEVDDQEPEERLEYLESLILGK